MALDTRHIVIIGGGVIGSAIASFLTREVAFRGTVTVIERDPTYARASSALSASSIRQQFSTPVNIAIGQYGIEFMREIGQRLSVAGDPPPDIGLVEPGYLFLASEHGVPILEANHATQRSMGAAVELLDPAALRTRFPWLATEGIALGAHTLAGEGWFDGYSLLQAFRRHARAGGARYLQTEARNLDVSAERIMAVVLADGSRIVCDALVNAAGPWAASVADWAGIGLPVRARRRTVFVFTSPQATPRCPLVIDPSGVYFRPEGTGYICGVSPDAANDPDEPPLEPEHDLFENILWPTLAARVPGFEALKQSRAWAGYYEMNTFDANGIVGAHRTIENFYFANGFSGHGIQQSPAVGRALAELIVHGGYRTLDLSALTFDRIAANQPLRELNVV
jgi:FAD-dependent oxidoreductase domain-containing protein 1